MHILASVVPGGEGPLHIGIPLLWAAGIILLAFVLGRFLERFGQAAVLGEIALGIGLSAIAGWALTRGVDLDTSIKNDPVIGVLAQLGLVLLLFNTGLEGTYKELRSNLGPALRIAAIGMVLPFLAGFGLALAFGMEMNVAIFMGAAMTATSVGITKRVLDSLGLGRSEEGKVTIAAAVFDDIGGLIILAVVVGLVAGAGLSGLGILFLVFKALVLVVGGKLVGQRFIADPLSRYFSKYRPTIGGAGAFAILIMFIGAGVARLLGLEEIVGAFVAGLMLEDVHFRRFGHDWHVEELVANVREAFVPLFFVLTGMQVDVAIILSPNVLGFGLLLSVLAIITKFVSGLGARKSTDRILIGMSMVPRGEVGIVFAIIGISSAAVLSEAQFAQIILMVVVTTFVAPIALSWHVRRKQRREGADD